MVLIVRLFGLSNQFQAVEAGSYRRKRWPVHLYRTSYGEARVTLLIVTEYKIVMQSPLVLYGWTKTNRIKCNLTQKLVWTLFWTFRYSVTITLRTCFKVKLRSDYRSFEILPDFEIRLHTVTFVQITNRSGRSYKKWSKWLNLSSCAALRCQLRELNRIKRKETSLSSISAAQSTCTGWVLRVNRYCCSLSPTNISLGNHK